MKLPVTRRGNKGHTVRYLQDLLCRNGIKTDIDGSFGPGTETNVKALQRKLNIQIDGVVGPASWDHFSRDIYLSGKAYNTPKVIENLIPHMKLRRSGAAQVPEWVTIHNTANPTSTALNERSWLLNPTNKRQASWHYAVDQNHAVLVIPEKEIAWHAGNATGNTSSIGIEVCESGNQDTVWANAVGLAANILYQYGFGVERLTTHNRWSGKNCPNLILSRWTQFAADVGATIESLKKKIEDKEPEEEYIEEIEEIAEETVTEEKENNEPIVEEELIINEPEKENAEDKEEPEIKNPEPLEKKEEPIGIDYGILNRVLSLIEAWLNKILRR